MKDMKLVDIKTLKGKIEVKTGLHIGAGNDSIEIGGMDNPIIKDPVTFEPYIPGSSIKGKMRSLMELLLVPEKIAKNEGKPCSCGRSDCPICRVFGAAIDRKRSSEETNGRGPTRLIVRDSRLSEESKKAFSNKPLTEEKNENSLNRITAEANPRPLERVVPGVQFDFEIAYRVFDDGDGGKTDEKFFKDVVLAGLAVLQNDYLGGGGSRGNGRIEFKDLKDESGNPVTLPELHEVMKK